MPSLDDIKRLPPSERIIKLHELEKKNKAEIEQAQHLLKESQAEEKRSAEIEEILQEVAVPQPKEVKPEDLWEKEKNLEEKAKEIGTHKEPSVEETKQYGMGLKQQPIEALQDKLSDIYTTAKQQGGINYDQRKEVENIYDAAKEKADSYHKQGYDRMEEIGNTTKSMAESLMGFRALYKDTKTY